MAARRQGWKAASKPAAFSAVAAIVVAGSVLDPGMDTADLELHDAGVWVSHEDGGYVGHLNHESRILDGGFRATFERYSLHQQDEHAVLVDPASGAWEKVSRSPLESLSSLQEPVLTAVGDIGVVVDSSAGRLVWDGGSVQDDRLVGAVPQPAGRDAAVVALSAATELLSVRLEDRSITSVPLSSPDDPAADSLQSGGAADERSITAPVQAAGCVHTASRSTGY